MLHNSDGRCPRNVWVCGELWENCHCCLRQPSLQHSASTVCRQDLFSPVGKESYWQVWEPCRFSLWERLNMHSAVLWFSHGSVEGVAASINLKSSLNIAISERQGKTPWSFSLVLKRLLSSKLHHHNLQPAVSTIRCHLLKALTVC